LIKSYSLSSGEGREGRFFDFARTALLIYLAVSGLS